MSAPPQFTTPRDTNTPAPHFLHNGLGLRGIVLLAILLAIAITGNQWRQSLHTASEEQKQEGCLVNMKQVASALLQYAQDNDNRLPEAGRWMTVTRPYIKDARAYHCPDALDSDFGYAFNNALSDMSIDKPQSPATLILSYDSTATTANATDRVTSLSPGRHWGMDSASFADGHVKLIGYRDVFSRKAYDSSPGINP